MKLGSPTSALLQAFVRSCPRHAELAVAELGLQAARHRHVQAAPSRKRYATTINWSQTSRRRITGCQQDWLPRVRQARCRVRLQRLQPRSRESNTNRPHTLEANQTILAPRATCRVGTPSTKRGGHRDGRRTLRWRRRWVPQDATLNI